jgi:hypothetical protein
MLPLYTPAPPSPPNGPSDWTKAVQGNRFLNIERLGLWVGKEAVVPSGVDPSPYFQRVSAQSLGAGSAPPTIYVLAHGWAPGYRSAVEKQKGDLLWWSPQASANGVWTSDWAWSPVTAPSVPLQVNSTGLLQSIVAFDRDAIVLAYSWIDDSATDGGYLNLDEVYRSEAYTQINGIRLANALEEAIASSFWTTHTGRLHLIGHSHGSKVASVAALTLQQKGRRIAQLTILDAPESELTLEANGANLLGFYLAKMQIANPSYDCAAGAFIDNYASYFGVGYSGAPNLANIVESALAPSELYDADDPGDQHSYAAAWYGGAAAGAASQGESPLGLAWPPAPKTYLPALNQNWPGGATEFGQWNLAAGPSIGSVFFYGAQPLGVTTVSIQGNVRGDPSSTLYLGPAPGGWPAYSIFEGAYSNPIDGDGYGMAFDILWTAPQPGDYLVVTTESPDLDEQEVMLVMDGQSLPTGGTSATINVDVSSGFYPLYFYVYFLAATDNKFGRVALSNFRLVTVSSSDGRLRAQRLAAAEKPIEASARTVST